MVDEHKMIAILTEFASTLVTDFPIQGILDHLVDSIVQVLPVSAAGVTLISEGKGPRYIAASDDSAMRFENVQAALGQGPCLTAYESGEAVAMPDLAGDERYPQFGPAARSSGLAATFTFPLRHGGGRLGALDLYRDTPGELDSDDLAAAQTLADVAAAYLLNAQARDEAQAAADRFPHEALHDSLTELPNRVLFEHRLEHAAQRARRSHSVAAVLFVDLDRFKSVNDVHGHRVGDELLRAVARRLSAIIRPGDTLARISGDEFVILCEDLKSDADADTLSTRIRKAFTAPFPLADGASTTEAALEITASVGVAYAGPGEDISNQLIVGADIAMHQAKQHGGGTRRTVDPREGRWGTEENDSEEQLRLAQRRNELELAYQPIVRSADGQVTGVEALLRWTPRGRGPVPPLEMISVAERSGLIAPIGRWVLERGCGDRAKWLRNASHAPLELAVNVSARQLAEPGFAASVATVLDNTDMDPAALILEMTEGVLLEDGPWALTVLREVKNLGIRLALDDFGTGYSSLSYLREFPVDIIKIDQGFTADIGRNPAGAAVISAVTNLAHALDLGVTVEGVETAGQHKEIVAIGCESAQGYLYARPMSAAEFGARLAASSGTALRLPLHATAGRG